VLADAGVENVNAHVDALIETGVLRRLLAFMELKFSNSMIEAWWRFLKHQWLLLHPLESVATIRGLVAFYVQEHNHVLPHSAFQRQTPDEMYFWHWRGGTGRPNVTRDRCAPSTHEGEPIGVVHGLPVPQRRLTARLPTAHSFASTATIREPDRRDLLDGRPTSRTRTRGSPLAFGVLSGENSPRESRMSRKTARMDFSIATGIEEARLADFIDSGSTIDAQPGHFGRLSPGQVKAAHDRADNNVSH
jgi:hypothetical protein